MEELNFEIHNDKNITRVRIMESIFLNANIEVKYPDYKLAIINETVKVTTLTTPNFNWQYIVDAYESLELITNQKAYFLFRGDREAAILSYDRFTAIVMPMLKRGDETNIDTIDQNIFQ